MVSPNVRGAAWGDEPFAASSADAGHRPGRPERRKVISDARGLRSVCGARPGLQRVCGDGAAGLDAGRCRMGRNRARRIGGAGRFRPGAATPAGADPWPSQTGGGLSHHHHHHQQKQHGGGPAPPLLARTLLCAGIRLTGARGNPRELCDSAGPDGSRGCRRLFRDGHSGGLWQVTYLQ